MDLKKRVAIVGHWHVNKSAVRGAVKKPPSGPWDGYFYDGPSWHFGHFPPTKKQRS
jgi:hypothetical protein